MANLPENGVWVDGVYQLETTDRVLGGAGGIANRQAEELGNRTRYLKTQTDDLAENKLGINDPAGQATKLSTARDIELTGDATGSASFDGTADASIEVTLAASGVAAGTYGSTNAYPLITVDSRGIITNAGEAVFPEQASQLPAHGQCRIEFVDAESIALVPYGGGGLVINGKQCQVTSGVTAPRPASSPSTLHYVYAKESTVTPGQVQLEVLPASTNPHSRDTSTGIEIKTGDPTRVLVGMLRTTAGSFLAPNLVTSWFNRRLRSLSTDVSQNTASTTGANLFPLSLELLVWSGEAVLAGTSGWASSPPGNMVTATLNLQRNTGVVIQTFGSASGTIIAGGRLPMSLFRSFSDTTGDAIQSYNVQGITSNASDTVTFNINFSIAAYV